MTIRNYYGLQGTLSAAINDSLAVLPVNNALASAIAANFVNGSDETYLSITSANLTEVVKVTAVNGNYLTVTRHESGTTAYAFPMGSKVSFVLTAEAVYAGMDSASLGISITGAGIAKVGETGGNTFSVEVDEPTFNGSGGISIQGSWPEFEFAYEAPEGNCCGGSGNGSGTEYDFSGSGIVEVYQNGNQVGIGVARPQFEGTGITITGSWPYLDFTVDGGSGSGTVTSVSAGAGLSLTGSPTVNPTLAISNTGVVAGDYGGVVINARGQITAVPTGFDPVSVVAAGTNVSVDRLGDTATVNVPDGDIGVRGALALSDPTDPFDPEDDENAISPAGVAAALAELGTITAVSASYFTAELVGEYSNVVAPTAQAITVEAGKYALVIAEASIVNATTPENPENFGIAVLGSSGVIQGNKKITQSQQSATFLITGAFADTITLATTAVPVGASLISYSLVVLQL